MKRRGQRRCRTAHLNEVRICAGDKVTLIGTFEHEDEVSDEGGSGRSYRTASEAKYRVRDVATVQLLVS